MSLFDSIIDQERIAGRLSKISRSSKIPHAMLFTGPEGVGKVRAAVVFAMACNCLKGALIAPGRHTDSPAGQPGSDGKSVPCGTCRSCKKILASTHPDIMVVTPEKAIIKIAQIRGIFRILSLKPYEAQRRVVIIRQADTMSAEAGNSLLKVLEEPPDRTHLILTAPHAAGLLPTIVSRCQHIRFQPIRRKTLKELLMQEFNMDFREADILSSMANGSITRARSLAGAGHITPDLLLAAVHRIAGRRADVGDALDIIKSWFRDLMIYPLAPEKIINKDMAKEIQKLSQSANLPKLLSRFKIVQSAQERIDGNANVRLTLDVMMMNLMPVCST
ncbi:MAG: DNA polymerase III subunit delta' [Deltaproteobacteria bacterium]